MPIKQGKPEPVVMIPAKDYVHQRLTLNDVEAWLDAARAAGVRDSQDVKAAITMRGWLKQLSATPEATDG